MHVPFRRLVRTVLLFAVATSTASQAQKAPKKAPKKASENLTAKADATISALTQISLLQDTQWRMHDGDLAHGESVDLRDENWTPIKINDPVGSGAVWVRGTVKVPASLQGYDLTGAKIWLDARLVSRPFGLIVYYNGRRVALGEDIEPMVLLEDAKPGEKIVVAIKMLASSEPKSFSNVNIYIEPKSSRPSPGTLREEALAVVNLLPSTQGYTPAMLAEANAAIEAIDLTALKAGNQTAFDASLNKAHQTLMKYRPAMQKFDVHMDGNSHIDAAWKWTESETIDVVKRTYGTAAQLMSEYPGYVFTQSAAQYNEWIANKFPSLNQDIKRRIAEGRWEIVGGMWVEPDLNMPDGESLVRQILLGKRFYKKEYGVDVRIGWNPDSFGYTWQLPQIYKKSGIDYFVTQKMNWSEQNKLPFSLFWWQSPDGSKVLTYFPTSYAHNDLNPSREAKDIATNVERVPSTRETLDLYGIGDHGGGPTRFLLERGIYWSQPDRVAPKMHFSTAQSFFSGVEKTITTTSPEWNYISITKWAAPSNPGNGMVEIPTWKDELYLETHRGVFTTQAKHKRNMRESEEAVLNAEKFAALAWLRGKAYPTTEFETSWKKISFGQFHDLAAGSGIGQIYKDADEDYKRVFLHAKDTDRISLPAIMATADTRAGEGVAVAVVNPLAWNRSGVVDVEVQLPAAGKGGVHFEDANGRQMLSQVVGVDQKSGMYHAIVKTSDVPSMGYQVLRAMAGPAKDETDLKAKDFTLENALLRVVIDPKNGCITSLFDKKSNFESIAAGGCGNQLQTFVDKPKKYDAWNIDMGTYDHMVPITTLTSIKLVDKGPLRASIQIERTWGQSHFLQEIVLDAGCDHVKFNNQIDWREDYVLLKAGFPLAATGPQATFDIPYGTIERSTLRDNSWDKARFEVPALRWADLGDGQHGLSLLNDAKYGYDAVGNWLRLTLLKSPKYPDPEADRGMQIFSYAVYPHAGSWKSAMSMRHGYEFDYPMQAMQVSSHAGSDGASKSFVSTEADNVVVTAVKKAEDRDALVFRMFEWAGKSGDVKLHVPAGATYAVSSDLMENPQTAKLPMSGDTVTVAVHPFEIVTVQVMYNKPM